MTQMRTNTNEEVQNSTAILTANQVLSFLSRKNSKFARQFHLLRVVFLVGTHQNKRGLLSPQDQAVP